MPQYCCVPDCKNRTGGFRFPKDLAVRKQWQIAIRRQDPVKKKLWEPGTHDVVCHSHFADSDYKEPGLLGKCFMVFIYKIHVVSAPLDNSCLAGKGGAG